LIALALISIATISTNPITNFDTLICFCLAALGLTHFVVGVELINIVYSGSYFRVSIDLISHVVDEFLKELGS